MITSYPLITIRLVEPYDLGDGSDLNGHIARNLPQKRCNVELVTAALSTAEDLRPPGLSLDGLLDLQSSHNDGRYSKLKGLKTTILLGT